MPGAFSEIERETITVIVFVGTFFLAVGAGRFLKRRAGVRLGLLFRLFCLILAFYAAIAVYGVHASWRRHVGAAAILLSTALVVALINRYVWDFYFEKKRQTPIPHFLREVVGGIIFLVILLFVLRDRKSTRLNSSHVKISYAVFCLKKKILNNKYIGQH